MKNFKMKNALSSLMVIMVLAIFMTSCQKEETLIEDVNVEVNDQNTDALNEAITYDNLTDLPEGMPSPQDVLTWSEMESNQDIEARSCIDVIRFKVYSCNNMIVDWRSSNNLALFVYHYKVAGNVWLGTTRINPTNGVQCNFRCDGFGLCPSGSNGLIKSVAFMGSGSTTYDSITKYWVD